MTALLIGKEEDREMEHEDHDDKKGPLENIPMAAFLFIPIMAGAGMLAILVEHLYTGIDPQIIYNIVTVFGGLYMLALVVLWVLFGRDMWPNQDSSDNGKKDD